MKVFISWSGERSKVIATILRNWLPNVLKSIKPWMSDSDIHAGDRWSDKLNEELSNSQIGIICLTPENINSQWLLFEAGAISKSIEDSRVVPFCFDLDLDEMQGPISQFQGAAADKKGVLTLLKTINSLSRSSLDINVLKNNFEKWWPDLNNSLRKIPKCFYKAGVVPFKIRNIYVATTAIFSNISDKDLDIFNMLFPNCSLAHFRT